MEGELEAVNGEENMRNLLIASPTGEQLGIPFTTKQFFQVFEKSNQTIFPMQFALILVATASVALAVSRKPFANQTISGLLGFLWLWAGVVYHLTFFTEISPPAYLFGALFVFQGLLFLYEGVVKNSLSFCANQKIYGILLLLSGVAQCPTPAAMPHVQCPMPHAHQK